MRIAPWPLAVLCLLADLTACGGSAAEQTANQVRTPVPAQPAASATTATNAGRPSKPPEGTPTIGTTPDGRVIVREGSAKLILPRRPTVTSLAPSASDCTPKPLPGSGDLALSVPRPGLSARWAGRGVVAVSYAFLSVPEPCRAQVADVSLDVNNDAAPSYRQRAPVRSARGVITIAVPDWLGRPDVASVRMFRDGIAPSPLARVLIQP